MCREQVSIHVIQSREHILNTVRHKLRLLHVSNISSAQYSEAISKFAEDKFQREGVKLITNAR